MKRLRPYLIASLTLMPVLALGWFAGPSGTVSGVEFSPDLFEHRSFRYLTWCGVPFTTAEHDRWRTKLDKYLNEQGFVTDSLNQQPRWQLVKGFSPGLRGWSGQAKWTCKALGCFQGKSADWVTWSERHPDMAEVLWPRIVAWVREGQHDLLLETLRDGHFDGIQTGEQLEKHLGDMHAKHATLPPHSNP